MQIKVGNILEHFFVNWKFAARVLLINFVVLPALIIGFAAMVNIPADVKIGFCIVALAAGAPFAPLLTKVAKGDVAMSTTLLLASIVGTVLVAPLALSPTVTALVSSIPHIPIWNVLWPFLLFLITPLILGCLVRLRYPEAAEHIVKPLMIIEIVALLLYLNVFITANLHLFGSAWGSGTYLAAVAVPILGFALGSLISREDSGEKHAGMITTAQRSISGAILITIFNYPQPLANVAVNIIGTIGIIILLVSSLEWGRSASKLVNRSSPKKRPAFINDK